MLRYKHIDSPIEIAVVYNGNSTYVYTTVAGPEITLYIMYSERPAWAEHRSSALIGVKGKIRRAFK
jgi:hypothetical protein